MKIQIGQRFEALNSNWMNTRRGDVIRVDSITEGTINITNITTDFERYFFDNEILNTEDFRLTSHEGVHYEVY